MVHELDLQPGDALPGHGILRSRFGVSNDTLGAAMGLLRDAGVVERRARSRTRVLDRGITEQFPWRIGVAGFAAPAQGPGVFYSILREALVCAFHAAGCETRAYTCGPVAQCHSPEPKAEDFPNLEPDLADGALDALAVQTTFDRQEWAALRAQGVPVCHVGVWEDTPGAVIVDRRQVITEAVKHAASCGCRRVMLVNSRTEYMHIGRHAAAFEQALTDVGLRQSESEARSVRPRL